MKRQEKTTTSEANAGEEQPIDAMLILREMTARWRGANTLEYRSEAIVDHKGEFRVVVQTHVRLRRPGLARIVFLSDRREASRLRVSDGRRLWDRELGPQGRIILATYDGSVTANIAHPLDEAGYSVDQFFRRSPFLPPNTWGDGRISVEAVRLRGVKSAGKAKPQSRSRDRFRVTFASGPARDTLMLDAVSFAPLSLRRVGEHAGVVQELLRETFTEFRLGVPLPASLFAWTEADEAGAVNR